MTPHALLLLFQGWGLWGLGLDIFFEALGLPLPGETLLVLAAGAAGSGALDIRAVALVAFLSATAGGMGGFFVGQMLGRPLVLRHGKRFGITRERLDRVEAVLEKRGALVIVLARFVVLARQLGGLAAGITGMHWARFLMANALGAALWVAFWGGLAWYLGPAAEHLLPLLWHTALHFAWITVPLALGAGLFAWQRWRRAS
jgi:membrane protein DedA with SNARE-associated domain